MARPTLDVEFYNAAGSPTDYATSTREIVIRRGKQRILDRQTTAVCEIVVDATVAALDPTSSSAAYGTGSFVVVSATGSGAARRIFSGWVIAHDTEFPDPNDGHPQVVWTCAGPFHALTGVTFPTSTFATTNETDVDELLDAIVAYAIGAGASLGTWVLSSDGAGGTAHEIDATGDTLSVMHTLAAQADGDLIEEFWNDPAKQVFRFVDRNRRYQASRFTFTDNAPSPPTSFPYDERSWRSRGTDDHVRNKITVSPNGLTAQTVEDSTSQTKYRKREYSRSTYHVSEAAASVLAQDLLAAHKTPPAVDVARIVVEPDAADSTAMWDLVIDVGYESASGNGPRLSDRITVTRTGPNGAVARECVVTGYEHRIRPVAAGGAGVIPSQWTTTLLLADAEQSKTAFILDTSALDTGVLI